MHLCSKDKRGSTPLHWACYQGSEVALIYLLGWLKQYQLTYTDQDGYTALHLAVKSSEQLKTGRPLRALLMRGAPRDIKSKKGKTPLDLVKDIESDALRQELRAALEDNGRCECLMLKTPLKKTEKSLSLPVAFLSFFNLVYIILIIFSFPSKYQITSSF